MFKIDKSMSDADVTPQYMIENIWIVGSPDDVAAQIRGLHNTTYGGFRTLLVMGHEWNPRYKWVRSMELLVN